jgi:N-acetylmuramoyl-L-alanine amidase
VLRRKTKLNKIDVLRAGHNYQSPGASGRISETLEARNVCAPAIKYLRTAGDTVIDGTPGNCSVGTDLRFGTDKANNYNADIFVPIHFNNAYEFFNGAIGSEVWVNPKNPLSVAIGTRVVNNLAALGFKNRGLKDGSHLHDVRVPKASTILAEVCFVEATEDIRIYKKVGADAVGKAIAEGILGHTISTTSTVVIVPATRVNNSIAQLQAELNKQGARLLVDGFYGPKTLAACPLLKFGASGNITKWLQKRLALSLQDGLFGNGTNIAVRNYQTALRLVSDGIVGQGTWNALLK